MRELLYRFRVPLLFVALVALTTATMLADRRSLPAGAKDLPFVSGALLDVAVPVQAAISAPFDFVRGLFRRYVALKDLRTENEQLRGRMAQLEEENLQYREALIASERLERIDKMRGETNLPMLPAEVASRELSPWYRSLLIDRGRTHDVHAGMPALTEDGVVGLVTAASPHAARIMLLLDRQSAIDALVQRSRTRGIVRGLGGEELEFEFTAENADVQVGDTLDDFRSRRCLSKRVADRGGRVGDHRGIASAPARADTPGGGFWPARAALCRALAEPDARAPFGRPRQPGTCPEWRRGPGLVSLRRVRA